MSVQDRDRGARKLVRTLGAVKKGAVSVGVLGADGEKEEGPGVTVVMVASWMEYGTATIPARPWLRGWIDEARPDIEKRMALEMRAVIQGTRTRDQALARLGVWAVGQIQIRIAAGIAPENAQSTIARKGSSTPLIDRGQFRSSITSRVE